MAVVLANPNWAAVAVEVDFTQGPPAVPGDSRISLNAAYRNISVASFATQRGRQYELDKVSAGTLHVDVRDPFERLNPDNPSGPYNTGGNTITPYRCIWVWAMWPNQPGTGNIINTKANTNYDPSFELNPSGLLGEWVPAGGTTTLARSTAQAFDGTNSLLVTQSGAGIGFGALNSFVTIPGLTYTFSAYVFLTAQTGLSVTVQVTDASGAAHSSTTGTRGAWQRLSVTWNAVDTLEPVIIYGTGPTTPTFHVDATQLEFGPAPTAFTTTGPTLYPLFTGYVERWPTAYDNAGFRALRPLEAVDALAVLSRTAISQSYQATIAADQPQVYLPWSATTPATTIALSLASDKDNSGVAPLVQGNPNYFIPPNGQISWAGDSHPDGTPAVSVSQQNANTPSAPGGANQDTGADILNAALSFDTIGGGTVEFWARPVVGAMSFGCCYAAAPGLQTNFATSLPMLGVETAAGANGLGMFYNPDGSSQVGYFYGLPGGRPFGSVYPDNRWHYFALTVYSGNMIQTFDGVDAANVAVTTPVRIGFTYISHISAHCGFGDPHSQLSFGRWACYPRALTVAQRVAHFNRGAGYANELSGARVTRLLNQYWGTGNWSAAGGVLQMAPDFSYDPYTA
ncbi:MAG: carbohydrate binding domain-containing protein, partial [Pseudonocardiaceae bacterium]